MFSTPGTGGGGVSGDPAAAYSELYTPGASRALQLFQSGQGFRPIDRPALPGLNARTAQGMDEMMAQAQGARVLNNAPPSYSTAMQDNAALGGLINRGGMATGTDDAFRQMNEISSGQSGIYTGQMFAGMANNPMTAQQGVADNAFREFQAGRGNVGTGTFQQFEQGRGNVSAADFRGLQGQNFGPSYSEQNLAGMASMTPGTNPYLDQIEDLISDRITAQSRAAASSAGRGYGSGFESGQTADAISRAVLEGRLAQYNADANRQITANQAMDSERMNRANLQRGLAGDIANLEGQNANRQFTAAQSIADLESQNVNRQMTAAESLAALGATLRGQEMRAAENLTNVQNQNIQNRMGASQSVIGARQQGVQDMMRATALRPEVLASRFSDADRMLQSGAVTQGRDDTNFADQTARMYQEQQAPFDQLNAYMASINGVSPQAALNYQIGQGQIDLGQDQLRAQQPSGFQQAIGTAGLIGGALNQTGLLQPITSGIGSAASSLIGGLF